MKRKLLFLISLFFIFGLVVLGRYLYLKLEIKEGRLKILSSPSSTIYLDDKESGSTPFEKNLRTGEYLLKLDSHKEATNAASWSGKVTIFQNTLTFVDWQLGKDDSSTAGVILSIDKAKSKSSPDTGEIEVDTEPPGSIVYLDNEEHGIAPLRLTDVEEGDHELSVFNPGFFRRTQKINVTAGYKVIAFFKLAIDPTYKRVDIPKEEAEKEASESGSLSLDYVKISNTETGFLRVRDKPGTGGEEVGQVDPGSIFKILSEEAGWFEIEYEPLKKGWISGQYAKKTANSTPSPTKSPAPTQDRE